MILALLYDFLRSKKEGNLSPETAPHLNHENIYNNLILMVIQWFTGNLKKKIRQKRKTRTKNVNTEMSNINKFYEMV